MRWQNIGDISIIQGRIISIGAWNPIDPIDFHFIIVIDFQVFNDSHPSRVIPKIWYSIINFNGEWIAVMPGFCPLPLLALETNYSYISEFFGFMFNNPPIWKNRVAGIFHRTYLEGFLGIVVCMLTGNWDGITPFTILHCISSTVLDFLLLFAGTKWDIVFFDPLLWGNRSSSSRIEQHSCWNVFYSLKWGQHFYFRSSTWLGFRQSLFLFLRGDSITGRQTLSFLWGTDDELPFDTAPATMGCEELTGKSCNVWVGVYIWSLCFLTEFYVASTFQVLKLSSGLLDIQSHLSMLYKENTIVSIPIFLYTSVPLPLYHRTVPQYPF